MRGIAFGQCGQLYKLRLVYFMRVHGRHAEHALCQRARFVEHHSAGIGQHLHIRAALHQNAAPGGPADAPEEGQRHADDKRARAADDKEDKRAVHPAGPAAAQHKRGQHSQRQRRYHHGRGVPAGKFCDKVFCLGLFLACVFHKVQNFGHGRFTVRLIYPHAQKPAAVDAAADDGVTRRRVARHAFTGEGRCVQHAVAVQHGAVQRHTLARLYQNGAAHAYFIRVYLLRGAVRPHKVGVVRPDIHQRCNRLARAPHRIALKPFAYLVEQHNRHAL